MATIPPQMAEALYLPRVTTALDRAQAASAETAAARDVARANCADVDNEIGVHQAAAELAHRALEVVPLPDVAGLG